MLTAPLRENNILEFGIKSVEERSWMKFIELYQNRNGNGSSNEEISINNLDTLLTTSWKFKFKKRCERRYYTSSSKVKIIERRQASNIKVKLEMWWFLTLQQWS